MMNAFKFQITVSLIVCFSLIFTIAQAQQPFIQKLGSIAQVTFPDKPEKKPATSGEMYLLKHNGIVYLAQALPIERSVTDMLNTHFTDSLINGYIKGFIKKDGKLIYKKPIQINGFAATEIMVKAPINGKMTYRYHQLVYANKQFFSYGLWSSDSVSTANTPLIKTFFSSFKPTIAVKDIKQNDRSERAYESGRAIGRIVGIMITVVFFLGIGVGIVFLIRKFVYRK